MKPLALCGLIALPIGASILALPGVVAVNPAGAWSFLATYHGQPWLFGSPGYVDASIGILNQPLGRLSALDWLHGIVPWWNPYSGIGMPLAAEMQTMSFFLPFILIFKWWQGWLVVKVLMQCIAGLLSYYLMRALGCCKRAAWLTGALFALNSSFLVATQAMGSMAFLPLLLLGLERAAQAARAGQTGGWNLIPFALAYSLYGGYPEVAYLDGLLAAVWALVRLAGLGPHRRRFAAKLAIGTVIGLMLTLPQIIPFLHYVGHTFLGFHKRFYAILHLRPEMAPVFLFPFIYGPIPSGRPLGIPAPFIYDWPDLGGWLGLTAVVPALAAIVRARTDRNRTLIVALTLSSLIGLARCFGLPYVTAILNAIIPDLARIDAIRFIIPAVELAVFILAGFGLDRWITDGPPRLPTATALVALLIAAGLAAVLPAAHAILAWYHASSPALRHLILFGNLLELSAGAAILIALLRRPTRLAASLVLGLIVLDSFIIASVPQLCAPRAYQFHRGGIAYLRAHLGLNRFYSLRPFGPDYPAGDELAALNDNQLPVSRGWSHYITSRLNAESDAIMFVGWWTPQGMAGGVAALRRNLANYEASGVKYIIADPGTDPFRVERPVPDHAPPAGAAVLGSGQSLETTLPAAETSIIRGTANPIDRIAILIGTYNGHAHGSLAARLCAGSICATGSAPLDHATDDAPLPINLTPPLPIAAGQTITLRLTHRQGPGAVAIWLRRTADGTTMPRLNISKDRQSQQIRRVYQDRVMTIYRLPQHRALFTASPACRLTPYGLNKLDADCPAPAKLTRLEAWFPGWHVTIDGHPAAIRRTGAVFQSISLPAGQSRVRFFYRPRGTRLAVSLALAALVVWVGLMGREGFFFVKKKQETF
jgi:hypothetical protein